MNPNFPDGLLQEEESKRGFSEPPALLGKQVAFTDVYAEGLEHDAREPSKRLRTVFNDAASGDN